MLIQCPKVIQQPKVIQLMTGPGYSFYSYTYYCLKVIQQPQVIQLTSGLGYSFYSYAYPMSQGNCTAKSYLVNGWSWIQLFTICLFSALRWFSSSYLKPALQWNQLLNKRLCYFLFIGSSICPLLPPLPVDPMLSMSTPTLPLQLPPSLHSMPTPLIKNPTSIIADGIPPIPTRRSY